MTGRHAPSLAPPLRVRTANDAPIRPEGQFVLYWMFAAHRVRFNFALDHAVARAVALSKPLVVLELVTCRYRWASARVHRFLLEGLADNAKGLARGGVLHHPFVEEVPGEGDGLIRALAAHACVVVADEFPAFFFPDWVAAEARAAPVLFEQVDGNGLLPMRAAEAVYPTAHSFRRFLQKNLLPHLEAFPDAAPLARTRLPRLEALPDEILRRWPIASARRLRGDVTGLPLDHGVDPVPLRGGHESASRAAARFVRERLSRYAEDRNEPERDGTSGLSPYLHFGHLSPHEVLAAIALQEGWSPSDVSSRADGSKSGWWGLGPSTEAFLDELVTWRELGFNFCSKRPDHDRYDSLPRWAQDTLGRHSADRRPHRYSFEELEAGSTHDPLWNACERQLVREGRIHGYLRMLWGKKILEWSPSPAVALETMFELNNRFALDGRDPNSSSGIFWVLGRYDRPWGPERPIFGTVRYMSSENTARKFRVKEYVRRYGEEAPAPPGAPL